MTSTGYNDTIHIDGIVYNDFFVENIQICRNNGVITYTNDPTLNMDHISAVYIKDI